MTRAVPDLRRRGRDHVRGDDRDRVRAPAARARARAPRKRRGVPRAGQPARQRAVHRRRRARAARARGGDRQAVPLRGLRGPAARPLRDRAWRAPSTRSRERALPFREGDEVLVTIVEPHMYNVDDAVAKIDGYIVSVTGGGAHVGEKRLVRIEEAGRTAATRRCRGQPRGQATRDRGRAAVAVCREGGAKADGKPRRARRRTTVRSPRRTSRGRRRPRRRERPDGDDVESKPRRRGRRGGRRRSAARAGSRPSD